MKKSVKIIFIILTVIMFISLPFCIISIKAEQTKRNLNLDTERYEQINSVCIADKDLNVCEKYLQEDLSLLMKIHQKNNRIINSPMSLKKPKYLVKILYKEQENTATIEPEILLKTMLLKRVLFKDRNNPIQAGILGQEMENYIARKFSDSNKRGFLLALHKQDENFERYTQKIKFKEENKKKKSAYSYAKRDTLSSDYY